MARSIHVVSRVVLSVLALMCIAVAAPLSAQQAIVPPADTTQTSAAPAAPATTGGPRLRPELQRVEPNFRDAGAPAPMPSDRHTFTLSTLTLVLVVVILVLLIAR
jgi:hypothetical protein